MTFHFHFWQSALCTWNIDRRSIDPNKPDASIDLSVSKGAQPLFLLLKHSYSDKNHHSYQFALDVHCIQRINTVFFFVIHEWNSLRPVRVNFPPLTLVRHTQLLPCFSQLHLTDNNMYNFLWEDVQMSEFISLI